jgi:adenosylcobinamide-phosphate synthase
MKTWQRVLCAAALDLTLGDPPGLPHPVRLMGRLAGALEAPCRWLIKDEKAAGALAATLVISTSALSASALVRGVRRMHPWLGDLASIALLYTSFASRDLADHAQAVQRALDREDLPAARQAVARIVGRDTEDLDTAGVVRAAVESVAENTVDGVTSPLFYALLGGAPAAVAFKAASTLDSMFGYKNERYLRFGWASARLDDVANYLPARVTVPMVAGAAALLGYDTAGVIRTVRNDGRKHASPNSGLAEAAFAGALRLRLGGPVSRGGRQVAAPFIGTSDKPVEAEDIRRSVELMGVTSLLFGGVLALVRGATERRRREATAASDLKELAKRVQDDHHFMVAIVCHRSQQVASRIRRRPTYRAA